ncbi:hypothetical protein H5410_040641 [Solanum commersonii]|uniref:Putative plant transposon protein domain-containing protein n=1 Tax=Solanum commersonii TaxID=4109 RepID=A0A9J5XRH4_SOLCO|nr:hypothetical protein H5410_040641 [Solanum commersonii]
MPTPATPPMAPALDVALPPPRLLNRLKGDGLRTSLEEKLLSVKGLEGKHVEVLDTIKYHKFEQFTRPRGPYILSWVREFFLAYGELVPKNKKKASVFRPVNSIMVRGKEVECHSKHINVVLGRPLHSVFPYQGLPIAPSLDDLKGWLCSMISNITLRWLDARAPIEKRNMNIASRYWFGFISITTCHLRTSLFCVILRRLAMTSVPFPVLIELCRCAGVPREPTSDIEVTPSSSTDI